MAEIKKALALELPAVVGNTGYIVLMSGQRASTHIRNITSIGYNEGYIFVTIETKNSIYKDIPIPVVPQDTFFNGQIIEPGATVMTGDGRYITVGKILEIQENGIRLLDSNNQSCFGNVNFLV